MGTLNAMGMAEQSVSLDTMLSWHLSANHYPPVDSVFIPVAKQAIEAAREAVETEVWEALDEVVTMPNGIEKSLGEILAELHLEAFVDVTDEEEV
jgi:hypothetical protein